MKFDDFFQRVTKIAGLSTQKDLARLLGIDPAAITLAKRRGVPKVWLLTLADKFAVNPEWLRTGLGPERGRDDAGIALVPKVSARACAGGGSWDVGEAVIDELPFERSWLAMQDHPGRMCCKRFGPGRAGCRGRKKRGGMPSTRPLR
jgi:hypothetical protein